MSVVHQAVAAITAEHIRAQFAHHDEKQLIRVRGFLKEEINCLVSELAGDPHFPAELIVIAKEPWDGIPEGCFLPPGTSTTHYRNAKGSYVFVEVEEFSDRSGMAFAYQVSDGNLLGQYQLDQATALLCLTHVWRLTTDLRDVPAAVSEGVKEIVAVHVEEGATIALRTWVGFLADVENALKAAQPVDGERARLAISAALPSLGLFPDSVLADTSVQIPRRRRLRENLLASKDLTNTGKEINREELVESLEEVPFVDPDGTPLSDEGQAELVGIIRRYLAPHVRRATTTGLDFHYWRQLFENRSKRRGLGTKIREELESVGGDALDVFEELEVEDGINTRDASSAQELIDAELESGVPLYGVLSDGLRRRIEKLANPKAPTTHQPLRDLVRLFRDLAHEDESDFTAVLEPRIRHGEAAKDRFSRALFAFLFGPILRSVQERTNERLEIHPTLLDFGPLQNWLSALSDPGEEDEVEELEWEPLGLQICLKGDESPSGVLEWDPQSHPGLIALARIVHEAQTPGWSLPSSDFETWCSISRDSVDLPGGIDALDSGVAGEWCVLREDFLSLIQKQGLTAELITDYCASWIALLARVHSDHVPAGASEPAVSDFLRVDMYDGPPGSRVVLATHPIRLRWIAEDLNRSSDLMVDALNRRLRLNSVNEQFFYDRLNQRSSHEQPAIICDASSVMVAVRESDWHEQFQQIKTRERMVTDWLGSTDDSSLEEIAKVIGRYTDAFPYKTDGLHLLFVVRQGGGRIVKRTVERFRRQTGILGRRAGTPLAIHVVCPATDFDSIAKVVEGLDASHRARSDFPSTRLILHEWEGPGVYPDLSELSNEIDLAVVPNLFAAQTRCQEASCSIDDLKGEFRPWIDRCTTRDSQDPDSSSASVSFRLLPEARDEVLSQWSTINVRHFRGSKVVAEGTGQDVDYTTLSVAVSEAEAFFEELHGKAHWVVTLDPFVGRRQLEAFKHRPEVITVKPGLGKGGGYTMIVSSQVGREFIQGRLARRLHLQLGSRILGAAPRVSEQIYQRARDLSPGLLLRATGLGRTAQEAVGLVASQSLTDQFSPPPMGQTSFVSWISLDERGEWFEGGQVGRADLLRVAGTMTDDELVLSFMVVEAKLRDESSLARALLQLDDSCQLVADAFRPLSEDYLNDAEFWWSSLLDAIEESARDTDMETSVTFRAYVNGVERSSLPVEWGAKLREGKFLVEAVDGTVCTFSETGSTKNETAPNSSHRWIQVTPTEMIHVLSGLDDPLDSSPPDAGADSDAELVSDVEVDSSRATLPELEEAQEPAGVEGVWTPNAPPVGPARGEDEGQLNRRYQRVLDTFVEHGVEVIRDEKAPVQEGPGFFVFRVKPGAGVPSKRLEAQVENLKLKMELPADLNPRAFIDRGSVVFEVPKQPEERYYVSADELWSRVQNWPSDRLWVSIGEDINGEAVAVDFSSNETPHLLIGGITGAGKSVALETILVGLLRNYGPEQLRISAVDPKNIELGFLEAYPHLDGAIGWDADDAKLLLASAVEEMQTRYARMKSEKARNLSEYNAIEGIDRLPWRLVILDEFADLTSDRDDKREIEHSLQRLAQKARACGIHVIVATQKPSAEVLSTKVRSNLGAQLALRVKNATDSRIIMDSSGAEALAGGGDAFLKTAAGGMVRFQCAKV